MLWQDLGNLYLGRRGLDRFKRSAHLCWCIGLHVERIDMAGCTQVKNHDTGAVIVLVLDGTVRLSCHVLGQRQSHGSQRAYLQDITTRHAVTCMGFSLTSYLEHLTNSEDTLTWIVPYQARGL